MTGRVRSRSCAPPFLRDFVRWRPDISRRRSRTPPSLRDFVRCRSNISCRRSCAPPSLRDFVRCRPDISRRWSCAPPSLGDFVRCRSDISLSAVPRTSFSPGFRPLSLRHLPQAVPRTSFSPRFRPLALRHLPPPAAGRCKPEKENQRSSELDADFLFRFAERRRFELLIPFWSIHAFQACLLSHSSISPELPCNKDRIANIRIIC